MWLKAQTLAERIEALQKSERAAAFYDHKKAKTKLASWKSISAFSHDAQRFDRRLQHERASVEDFLKVLGTPPDKIFPKNWKPSWWQEILRSEDARDTQSITCDALEDFSERGIISPFLPLIQYYGNQLISRANGIPGLTSSYTNPEKLLNIFLESFLPNFEFNVRRAVVLEVNSLRLLGKLRGDTSSERFQDFANSFRAPIARLAFFEKYPVLARYAQRDLALWVEATLQFLRHLLQDREEIQAIFEVDSDDVLTSFHPSGDTHNRGRSVAKLVFESGNKLLYKPRDLKIDSCFQDFLRWCNANGLKSDLKLMTILSYEDHGWVEFMEKKNTQDDEEYFDFYFRLGSLLAILHSIESVDVHFENLVASGAHPIVVDLETLFHTELTTKPIRSASDLSNQIINNSVMSVGILPRPSLSAGGRKTFDISGIGASIDQQAPYNVVGIDNFGRDDIRITNIPGWIPSVHSRPDDTSQKPIPTGQILDGFYSAYEVLKENREFLLSDESPLAPFKMCRRRLIVRDTRRYGGLQMDAFHPDLLRDDLDRSWHYDNLWSDVIERPIVERFLKSELNQIEVNDIPHFTVEVDGNNILGADGTTITGVEATSGWKSAKLKLERLSNDDRKRQMWFIRASLGEEKRLAIKPSRSGSKRTILRSAREIGDEVLRNLIWHRDSASFLKVVSIVGENKSASDAFSIRDADWGVYEGSGGVILFLAYLGKESKQEKYTDAAKALLNNMKTRDLNGRKIEGLSGFFGYGSLVYVHTHLGTLWGDTNLLRDAEEYLDNISPIIGNDESFDVLTGLAGCILSILPLASVNPKSMAKKIAISCGDYLVGKQENGKPRWMSLAFRRGFSHGFAGVALALHKLGQICRRKKYIIESLRIIECENLLLREGQWTDSHRIGDRCQVSWCHGAPGIALGRLAMYQETGSADLRKDIESSLTETRDHFWMASHCLCHGTLGNLEPLLIASNHPEFSLYTTRLPEFLNSVLRSLTHDGWHSLLPSQTLSLGLMTGLSGVGYSLLRFHNSDNVPSVLLLEGPRHY